MQNFIKKLSSRKFLTCIAGVVLGTCMTFGLDVGTVNVIAGAVTSIMSVVTYIYTEGKIDAAAVNNIEVAVGELVEAVEEIEE